MAVATAACRHTTTTNIIDIIIIIIIIIIFHLSFHHHGGDMQAGMVNVRPNSATATMLHRVRGTIVQVFQRHDIGGSRSVFRLVGGCYLPRRR